MALREIGNIGSMGRLSRAANGLTGIENVTVSGSEEEALPATLANCVRRGRQMRRQSGTSGLGDPVMVVEGLDDL